MSKLPQRPDYGDSPALVREKKKKQKMKPADIRLDMPHQQLKGVDVGDRVKITITGKVKSFRMVEKKGTEDYYDNSDIVINDPDIVLNGQGSDTSDLNDDED